ncbi:MAG: hypothetical protein BMS9Abin36_0968 [Gammaproteobacteria bacterium]|nr:MAG: hypothetical protein BMS9Abin36_0968 [Gammaproteobacteria bacterium]
MGSHISPESITTSFDLDGDVPEKAATLPDGVRNALEMLVDAIHPPEELQPYIDAMKSALGRPLDAKQLEGVLIHAANVVAETRWRLEQGRKDHQEFLQDLARNFSGMDKALQGTEMQTQAGYQGTQKVGTALERQLSDMNQRLKRTGSKDDSRMWLQQRLAIAFTRLDDFKEKGSQQHSTLHGQLHTLSSALHKMEHQLSGLQGKLVSDQGDSLRDPLTGVPSRLGYEHYLRQVLAQDRRKQAPTVLQVWDVDKLGELNDRYGRKAGDRTLRMIARLLKRHLRDGDFIAHYGSDTFVTVLNDTDFFAAKDVADRLMTAISEAAFHCHGKPVSISVSGGYANAIAGDSPQALFRRATEALDRAKAAGGHTCLPAEGNDAE